MENVPRNFRNFKIEIEMCSEILGKENIWKITI